MTYIYADIQRIISNASCMTISGGRNGQLDIFCCVTGVMSDFLRFHSCGTYSVLSRIPSILHYDPMHTVKLLSPPTRLCFRQHLFVSSIMQKLLNHFSQNVVERWHIGGWPLKKPLDYGGDVDYVILG